MTEQQQRWPEQQEFISHIILESPGSGCQLMGFMLRAFILVCRQLPPMAEKIGSKLSAVSSCKSINSIKRSPPSWPRLTLNTPTPPYKGPIPSYHHIGGGCCCSVAKSCPTLCNPMNCNKPGFPVLHYLPKFAQVHVHRVGDGVLMPSSHLVLCCPLLLLPSIFASLRVFTSESALCIRWPKYWSFNFSISPSNEYSGLISFRINWFDLLAVQGILKSLLQHHSSKVWILWHSAFLIVQLSHPCMASGKTIALTIQTFVGKVMSLLFNTM